MLPPLPGLKLADNQPIKYPFTVVSMFTEGTLYQKYAETLKASLDKYSISYFIDQIPNFGSWNKNTQVKPNVILKYLLNLKSPVLWLDCDCEVVEPLDALCEVLNTKPIDFAIYNWFGDESGNRINKFDPTKLLCSGGTIYFNYTAPALNLLIRWLHETNKKENNGVPEDLLLDKVFNESKIEPNCCWLPKAFNRMEAHWPDEKPIINHKWFNGNLFNGKEEVKY